MTRDEVRELLDRVSAIWGRPSPSHAVVAEWTLALATMPTSRCHETLDRMRAAGMSPGPNLAQFVAGVRALMGRDSTPMAEYWNGPTDAGRAAIARIRGDLEARSKGHHPSGGAA